MALGYGGAQVPVIWSTGTFGAQFAGARTSFTGLREIKSFPTGPIDQCGRRIRNRGDIRSADTQQEMHKKASFDDVELRP